MTAIADEFTVALDVFEGPFDLLLNLISKHKLDITEVSLSKVTDDFIAHMKTLGGDLEQTSQFLVVAATLLDLKTARLLPAADVEDEEDLALLEARDLLFARLLQYKAFKEVAALVKSKMEAEERRHPRQVALDPRFAELLPEVVISVTPAELAALAARALMPKPEPVLTLQHLHAPTVSVREQAHLMVDRLRRDGAATFRALISDAPDIMTKVARFLAVLELFREGVIAFEQATPLGDLHLRWTGSDIGDIDVGDEYDESYTEDIPEELDQADAEPKSEQPESEQPESELLESEKEVIEDES